MYPPHGSHTGRATVRSANKENGGQALHEMKQHNCTNLNIFGKLWRYHGSASEQSICHRAHNSPCTDVVLLPLPSATVWWAINAPQPHHTAVFLSESSECGTAIGGALFDGTAFCRPAQDIAMPARSIESRNQNRMPSSVVRYAARTLWSHWVSRRVPTLRWWCAWTSAARSCWATVHMQRARTPTGGADMLKNYGLRERGGGGGGASGLNHSF